jgi:hypothetical protein
MTERYPEISRDIERSIKNLELVKRVLVETLKIDNDDGLSEKDIKELSFDFDRAITALKKNDNPWNPADEPPDNDRAILASFENFGVSEVAYYRKDEEGGGSYYISTCKGEESLLALGFVVNGWMELPECKREEQ